MAKLLLMGLAGYASVAAEEAPIYISMFMEGVDYSLLMQDVTMKSIFDHTMKDAMAYRQAYKPDDVDVYISGGSVVITGRVNPPPPVQSNGLIVHLKFVRQEIIDRAVQMVGKIPGIAKITSGTVSAKICGIDKSRTKAWADCRALPNMGAALTPLVGAAPAMAVPGATAGATLGAAPAMTATVGVAPFGAAPVGTAPVGAVPAGAVPVGTVPAGGVPLGTSPVAALNDPLASGPTLVPMESMPANVGAAVAIGMTKAEDGLKRGLIGAYSMPSSSSQNSDAGFTAASMLAVTFAVFGAVVAFARARSGNVGSTVASAVAPE